MIFPPCDSTFETKTPDGIVLQRVCLNKAKSTYEKVVAPKVCRMCKSPNLNPNIASITERAGRTRHGDRSGPPSLFRRAVSYAEAVIEWTAAGRPERSDEDVQRIFNEHCQPCKSFDPKQKICRKCGCRVTSTGLAILNKIKMATQHCPKGKW